MRRHSVALGVELTARQFVRRRSAGRKPLVIQTVLAMRCRDISGDISCPCRDILRGHVGPCGDIRGDIFRVLAGLFCPCWDIGARTSCPCWDISDLNHVPTKKGLWRPYIRV